MQGPIKTSIFPAYYFSRIFLFNGVEHHLQRVYWTTKLGSFEKPMDNIEC